MLTTWALVAITGLLSGDVQATFLSSGATAKTGGYRPIRAELSERPQGIQAAPKDLNAAEYGTFALGEQRWAFVIDNPAGKSAVLYVDTNGDGDLTNDPAAVWEAQPEGSSTAYRGTAQVKLSDGNLGTLGLYRFDGKDPRRAALKDTVLFYTDFGYELKFELDGKEFSTFTSGDISPGGALWVDRDGNQRRSQLEVLRMGEPFNFTGTTYVMTAASGKVSLAKADAEIPMTPLPPDLALGKKALPFTAKTLDGQELKFPEAYQGKIVMLDFWATWCGPCIAELPNVHAAYEKWHDQGFEILGISFDNANMEEKLREFTTQNNMSWQHIYEGKQWNTELGKLYDVSAIPFVLLVDGDSGEILGTSRELRGPGLSNFIGKILAERKKAE